MARRKHHRMNPAPIIPVYKYRGHGSSRRRNLAGFMDVKGKFGPKGRFHPVRASGDYDPEEEGDRTRDWSKWERTARGKGPHGKARKAKRKTSKRRKK